MITKELTNYNAVKGHFLAYACHIFSANLPEVVDETLSLDIVTNALKHIKREIPFLEAAYVLDSQGVKITNNITNMAEYRTGKDKRRNTNSYYINALKNKKCVVTDPYPSSLTKTLSVTASYPIYNVNGQLLYVACFDVALTDVEKLVQVSPIGYIFAKSSRFLYGVFSTALFLIAALLFTKGMYMMFIHGFSFNDITIENIFEATILVTLSLALFDLVKTIFEEEVLGRNKGDDQFGVHKTMMKFLGSIIIALSIEALMLVFKFALYGSEKLVYAVYLLGGVTILIVGLAYYIKIAAQINKKD